MLLLGWCKTAARLLPGPTAAPPQDCLLDCCRDVADRTAARLLQCTAAAFCRNCLGTGARLLQISSKIAAGPLSGCLRTDGKTAARLDCYRIAARLLQDGSRSATGLVLGDCEGSSRAAAGLRLHCDSSAAGPNQACSSTAPRLLQEHPRMATALLQCRLQVLSGTTRYCCRTAPGRPQDWCKALGRLLQD